MSTAQADLLTDIEAFLASAKIAESTFGRLAVNDGKFVPRLRAGANMTLNTIGKARAFLNDSLTTSPSDPDAIQAANENDARHGERTTAAPHRHKLPQDAA